MTGEPAVIAREIAAVRSRLTALRSEQVELEASLTSLQAQLAEFEKSARSAPFGGAAVTSSSPSSAKVDLFRRLFRGRTDVFPLRWENRKTGKAGYAPACANEWAQGLCAKPKVKCGQCPHQAFIALSDGVNRQASARRQHRLGRFRRRRLGEHVVFGVVHAGAELRPARA